MHYIASHPGRTAWRTLNRIRGFWGFDYLSSRIVQNWAGLRKVGLLALLALEGGGYVLCCVLVLLGGLLWTGSTAPRVDDPVSASRRYTAAWLLLLVLAYQVPYMLAFSGGTYHFPVIPLLLPFAGLALVLLRERRDEVLRTLRRPAFLLGLAVFLIIQLEYAYYAIAMDAA